MSITNFILKLAYTENGVIGNIPALGVGAVGSSPAFLIFFKLLIPHGYII